MSFDHYSTNAKRVILRVQALAVHDQAPAATAKHLLAALLVTDSTATGVIAELGVNPRGLANALLPGATRAVASADPEMPLPPLGASVKATFLVAAAEAAKGKQKLIGTEHLLLALLNPTEDTEEVIAYLHESQITQKKVRAILDAERADDEDGLRVEDEDTPLFAEVLNARRAAKGGRPGDGTTGGLKFLPQHARNLTADARKGKIDPVIGRDDEIRRLLQILSCKGKNNPLLLGEPGVGKTAVVEALAQALIGPHVPKNLRERDLWLLDVNSLIAGTKFRGDFEERVKKLFDEARSAKAILFIDEIHTAIGAGTSEAGSTDLANFMKPFLARGELQTIGATTEDEYRKYFQKDPAFDRRFQAVTIHEPSNEATVRILAGLRDAYENWHDVELTDEALEAAVRLSARYITDRFLPDKAITLVDEAASRAQFTRETPPLAALELERLVAETVKKKEEAIVSQDFTQAAVYRDRAEHLQDELDGVLNVHSESAAGARPKVTADDIAYVVAESTGIPVEKVGADESRRLLRMEKELNQHVVGQEQAMKALSRAVRRSRAGLKDPNRPAGSFIFAGTTGTGKTESAKALAEFLFGQQRNLLTFDMSEYAEKQSVSRLIGSPPGYVGHDEGGQLTEAVRKRPFSVILLDEVEKAHPDVFDTLLQVLEEGRLTDGKGRSVNFRDTVVILTTNLGAGALSENRIGFAGPASEESEYADRKQKLARELENHFKPELLNRFDDVIVFSKLSQEAMTSIASLLVEKFSARLAERGVVMTVTPAAAGVLASAGFHPAQGARMLRREIVNKVEDPVTELLLAGALTGDTLLVDWDETSKFTFNGYTVSNIDAMVEGALTDIITDDVQYATT